MFIDIRFLKDTLSQLSRGGGLGSGALNIILKTMSLLLLLPSSSAGHQINTSCTLPTSNKGRKCDTGSPYFLLSIESSSASATYFIIITPDMITKAQELDVLSFFLTCGVIYICFISFINYLVKFVCAWI